MFIRVQKDIQRSKKDGVSTNNKCATGAGTDIAEEALRHSLGAQRTIWHRSQPSPFVFDHSHDVGISRRKKFKRSSTPDAIEAKFLYIDVSMNHEHLNISIKMTLQRLKTHSYCDFTRERITPDAPQTFCRIAAKTVTFVKADPIVALHSFC